MSISINVWGDALWTTMYAIADRYPEQPTIDDKKYTVMFFEALSQILPCEECKKHYCTFISRNPVTPACKHRSLLLSWVNELENAVLTRLGKETKDLQTALGRLRGSNVVQSNIVQQSPIKTPSNSVATISTDQGGSRDQRAMPTGRREFTAQSMGIRRAPNRKAKFNHEGCVGCR